MLSELIKNYQPASITKDLVLQFGDEHDGVIEFPGITNDHGVIEVGYFYGDIKPKNIIPISSQIGCPFQCKFCEIGAERFKRNLNSQEFYDQVVLMLQQANRYGIDIDSIKHKVSLAKTGEPLLNKNLVDGLEKIAQLGVSFKVSTIFPQNIRKNFDQLAQFAANYQEPVQLQISLISTSEEYRNYVSGGKIAPFKELRSAADYWKKLNPQGRKVNLSLILTEQVPLDVNDVIDIFPQDLFRFRFRNYVPTKNGDNQGLTTITLERIKQIKKSFRERGYEVKNDATPTPIEQKFGLASNITRKRYLQMIRREF